MGEYLKMGNVFEGEIIVGIDGLSDYSGELFGEIELKYAAHAINSHDELVENMQHYEADALMWERRAATEASRAQGLVAEVERLRDALQDAYLDGCHYGWEMSAEGYNAEHGGPNDGRLHNQFIESYSGEPYISE